MSTCLCALFYVLLLVAFVFPFYVLTPHLRFDVVTFFYSKFKFNKNKFVYTIVNIPLYLIFIIDGIVYCTCSCSIVSSSCSCVGVVCISIGIIICIYLGTILCSSVGAIIGCCSICRIYGILFIFIQ